MTTMTAMTKPQEITACERALTTLLDELVRQRKFQERQRERDEAAGIRRPPIRLIPFEEIAVRPLADLYADPIDAALLRAIRTIGKRLFDLLGSTDPMLAICNRVARKEGRRNTPYRIGIIDKTWDGIGNERDVWGA